VRGDAPRRTGRTDVSEDPSTSQEEHPFHDPDPPEATDSVDEATAETGQVVGLTRRRNTVQGGSALPFSSIDEAFIERAVSFLRRRPNADLILDEVCLLLRQEADGSEIDESPQDTTQETSGATPSNDLADLSATPASEPPRSSSGSHARNILDRSEDRS
jgi:hypothetical protein